MKTGQTTLRSEWLASTNRIGTLLIGGLVVLFVLGGPGALLDAVRVVGVA